MDLVTITRKEGLAFGIKVRGHELISDMSASDGGGDAGPSPSELLGISLGACVAMMAQSYCDFQQAGEVCVDLTLELADNPKRVAAIVVDLGLPDGFPQSRVAAVRRAVEKCLIHETLRHPPRLEIEIA